VRLFAGPATRPSGAAADAPESIADPFTDHVVLLLDDDDDKPKPAATSYANQTSGRYFLGLLDHRSSYGQDFFHDPFIGPEFDAEQQLELDYLHGEKRGVRDDEVDAGFQWNVVGQLSVAGEFGWDSEHQAGADGDDSDSEGGSGMENVDLAVYHPIFQYVSKDNLIDYTAAARLDVGIPTRTPVSGTDAELTPYLGHLLRVGDHVSLEAWTGAQFTIAPRQTDQFIYGASFGYEILHDQLPLPRTGKLIPIFELDGRTQLTQGGQDALFGVGGFDIDFKSLDEVQPHIEIGCQFPIDAGAREQLHWGIITELLFEF
jgi:hypothetical protein